MKQHAAAGGSAAARREVARRAARPPEGRPPAVRRRAAQRTSSARRRSRRPAAAAATRSSPPERTAQVGPSPRQPRGGRAEGGRADPRLRPGVDRKTRTRSSSRATARRDAPELQRQPLQRGDRRARHVSLTRGRRPGVIEHHHRTDGSRHRSRGHAPSARPPDAPGLRPRRLVFGRCSSSSACTSSSRSAGSSGWDPVYDWNIIVLVGGLSMAPDRLPARHRRLRLLALLDLGPPDARPTITPNHGALPLEGLLQGQHRPQGDRRPVPRHDVRLLHRRRPDGDALPRRARAAGHAVHGHADLQRARLHARRADDLRLHHPGVRRPRELRRAADARRAGHGVPAPERALVLAAADRRDDVPVRASSHPAARSRPAGRATRRSRPSSRSARCSSTWASSGPAPRRS